MKTSCFAVFKGPGRICIARYAPRGTPAGFRMFKVLAPGEWFNQVPEDEYRRRYFGEILGPLDPRQVVTDLERLAEGEEPVPSKAGGAPGAGAAPKAGTAPKASASGRVQLGFPFKK
jgi:hypothetical protein